MTEEEFMEAKKEELFLVLQGAVAEAEGDFDQTVNNLLLCATIFAHKAATAEWKVIDAEVATFRDGLPDDLGGIV